MVSNKRKGYKFQSAPKSINQERNGSANILFNQGNRNSKQNSARFKKSRKDYRQGYGEGVRPVSGRKHAQIQTSKYLEEIRQCPIEKTISTQTEAELDYSEKPLFVPQTSGISVATQIENGDLFNFDLEIEPILETLIGKTLDISLMEVSEETELKALQKWKEIYQQRRNAELTECQRLQEVERRLFEEKERRKRQATLWKDENIKKTKHNEAKRIAKNNLEDLKANALEEVSKDHSARETILEFISTNILQNIYVNVTKKLQPRKIATELVDAIAQEIIKKLDQISAKANKTIEDILDKKEKGRLELLKQNGILSSKMENVQELFQGFMESEDALKFEISQFLQLEKKKKEQAELEAKLLKEKEEAEALEKAKEEAEALEKAKEEAEKEKDVKKKKNPEEVETAAENEEETPPEKSEEELEEERKRMEEEEEEQKKLEEEEEERRIKEEKAAEKLNKITENFKSEENNYDYLFKIFDIQKKEEINVVHEKIKIVEEYLQIYELRTLSKKILELFTTFSDEDKDEKMKSLDIDNLDQLEPNNLVEWNLQKDNKLKQIFEEFIEQNTEKPEEENEDENEPEA